MYRKVNTKSVKKYHKNIQVQYTKACSIYDIINDNTISLKNKVSWIRHHYTYYDTFKDMFHDEFGKPNANKKLLNELLFGIATSKYEVSVLDELNKTMIEWRKEHPIIETSIEDIEIPKKVEIVSENLKTSKTKDECIKLFAIEFPHIYNILNQQNLADIAVNHYKSNFEVPDNEQWIKEITLYQEYFGPILDEYSRFISKKLFKKIRKFYKTHNNISSQTSDNDKFQNFLKAYNKYAENM